MAPDLREESRRLHYVVLKLTAEIGGKNQKLEYLEKMLGKRSASLSKMTEERDRLRAAYNAEKRRIGKDQKFEYLEKLLGECSTSLSKMTKERNHLNQAYNEEKKKMKRTMDENERLMKELETQRKEIEQQATERSISFSRMTEERDHLNEAYNEEKRKTKRTMDENERLMRELETQRKEIKLLAEERSTLLSRMTEKRDHLNEAYNEAKRKMKRTMYENERLMKELETQRNEQQAMEIEKRYAHLDLKSKQLLVLKELNTATRASRKRNTVRKKREGVKNMSRWGKVQVQIDTNFLHKELEEKDSELDNELNLKKTLVEKENRSDHDLQEACKVSIE
ncbi:hypothetical protein MKW94_006986, partial [Papaver nudicaule]|nr:hypothetical protein [Papaver nudicaule]